MRRNTVTVEEARRIALAAQGFDRCRPQGSCDARHIRRVIRQLGLLQLDFVNVLVPAHYLVVYSRLGPYARERFDRLVYGSGEFTEQWAHEASIVPVDCWPLLEHRRREFRPWPNNPIMKFRNRKKYLDNTLEQVRRDGPVTSQDLPSVAGPARKAGDWHRSIPRCALEYHFGSGQLAVADRLKNFQRVYDLPDRLIEKPHLQHQISDEEAQRALLKRAADSYGIATLHDLADYYRMSPRDARTRVAELVEDQSLIPIEVDGWSEPAFVSPGTRLPKSIAGASLLSPFDPVVWYRNRAERLFDFHYRIEIYVPEKKRRWGYYVLPFLLDGRLVARVDLKADRDNSTLLVQAAHPENDIDPDRVVDELLRELKTLSAWLELDRIKCRRRGAFARLLADRCRATQ